ncbi:hypothetical protein CLU79DRAFT_449087 [Phycomyces nitens]|nr:hypothetical protein CLU79DRAFT_449087 [Phycomyces nitens]
MLTFSHSRLFQDLIFFMLLQVSLIFLIILKYVLDNIFYKQKSIRKSVRNNFTLPWYLSLRT